MDEIPEDPNKTELCEDQKHYKAHLYVHAFNIANPDFVNYYLIIHYKFSLKSSLYVLKLITISLLKIRNAPCTGKNKQRKTKKKYFV